MQAVVMASTMTGISEGSEVIRGTRRVATIEVHCVKCTIHGMRYTRGLTRNGRAHSKRSVKRAQTRPPNKIKARKGSIAKHAVHSFNCGIVLYRRISSLILGGLVTQVVPYTSPLLVAAAKSMKAQPSPMLSFMKASRLDFETLVNAIFQEVTAMSAVLERHKGFAEISAAKRECVEKLDGPFLLQECANHQVEFRMPADANEKRRAQASISFCLGANLHGLMASLVFALLARVP